MTQHLPPPKPNLIVTDQIFVSYSRLDRLSIGLLVERLRQKGYRVWLDVNEIRGGSDWKQELANTIYQSVVILLGVSPDAVKSPWVEAEIEAARRHNKLVIPVVVRLNDNIDEEIYPNIAAVVKNNHRRDLSDADYEEVFVELCKDLPPPTSYIRDYLHQISGAPEAPEMYVPLYGEHVVVTTGLFDVTPVNPAKADIMELLSQFGNVILLGQPGSGKTFVLKQLMRTLPKRDIPCVPVMISLSDYDGTALLEFIHREIISHLTIDSNEEEDVLRAQVDNSLRNGTFEWQCFFDGLDSVPNAHSTKLINEIMSIKKNYPHRLHMIITSRTYASMWRLLRDRTSDYVVVRLVSLQEEQVLSYLRHYLDDRADKLWQSLGSRMQKLLVIPLLLSMMKDIWMQTSRSTMSNALPKSRGEIYKEFFKTLFDRGKAGNYISQELSLSDYSEALMTLATLMQPISGEFTSTLSENQARTALNRSVRVSLDSLIDNHFMIKGGSSVWFAPHQSFQEYFAACNYEDNAIKIARDIDKAAWTRVLFLLGVGRGLYRLALDPNWIETFVQLSGLITDASNLAKYIRTIARVNIWLAWICIQEGNSVDETTSNFVVDRVKQLAKSSTWSDRGNAALMLRMVGDERATRLLAQMTFDDNPDVASVALSGLLSSNIKEGTETFEHMLCSKSIRERVSWGRSIANKDPRRGLGLDHKRIPQIEWSELITPGKFEFGGDNRVPIYPSVVTSINIEYSYRIALYPVTYRQYESFVIDGGYADDTLWTTSGLAWRARKQHPSLGWNDPNWHLSNHPVVGVTWYEACAFCNWLSKKDKLPTGFEIRLPTESEWERAARSVSNQLFPWGNEYISNYANVESTDIASNNSILRTTAVGIFPEGKNDLGIYDLAGNVWEWCLSKMSPKYEYPEDNSLLGDDPRVLRGGSWKFDANFARSATRGLSSPYNTSLDFGFRLCLGPKVPY